MMELLLERDRLLSQQRSQPHSTDNTDNDRLAATSDTAARILSKPVILLDGGLGTSLQDQYEVEFTSSTTPTWSSHLLIDEPETLLAAQTAFSRAGAEVLLTATYQASSEGFAATARTSEGPGDHGSSPAIAPKEGEGYTPTEAAEFMRSAIRITRFAIGSRPGVIALSLGPYGATMLPQSTEYTGAYGEMADERKLFDWHMRRIRPYGELWNEFDLVAWETVPRVDEIRAIRMTMSRIPARKKYWLSCVFVTRSKDRSADEKTDVDAGLPDGTGVRNILTALLAGAEPRPWAIGINCTNISHVPGLIRQFEESATTLSLDLPRLVIYPDGAGGKRYDAASETWIDDLSLKKNDAEKTGEVNEWEDVLADIVAEVKDRGRWKGVIVGGCCKVTPKMIGRLKKRLVERKLL